MLKLNESKVEKKKLKEFYKVNILDYWGTLSRREALTQNQQLNVWNKVVF